MDKKKIKLVGFLIWVYLIVLLASLTLLSTSCTTIDWDTEVAIYEVYHKRVLDEKLDVESELRERGLDGGKLEYALKKLQSIKHEGR